MSPLSFANSLSDGRSSVRWRLRHLRVARSIELSLARRFVRVLHCVELDEHVGRKAGAYRLRFGRSHGVEIADALIAAAAHVHGMTLCSRTLRHYPMRGIKKRRL